MKGGSNPDFHIPTEIYIRQNIIADIGNIIKKCGSKIVLITTSSDFAKFNDIIEQISKNINNSNLNCIIYDEIPDHPDTEFIDSAVYYSKKTKCDTIIGFGGLGSINAAKAVSLLINNNLFCNDIFEYPQVKPPLTLITVPTHPIIGFEILPILFLKEIHQMTNRVYINKDLYPVITIVDPIISTLTDDETAAECGISSLAMATESVVSPKSNIFVNIYALKAIDLIFQNLPFAYRDPKDPDPRTKLSMASVMSGIAFSTTGLSLSLAISLALSSFIDISLFKIMGILLPHVMEYNLTSSSAKYVQMSRVMDEDIKDVTVIEAAIKAVEGVRKLEMDVNIPQRLSQFDISKSEFSKVAELAFSYPFVENAPRPLNKDEIETVLIAAY